MRDYQGHSAGDQIKGGGSYVEEHGHGFEMFNFKPIEGRVYGYVRPVQGGGTFNDGAGIKLERLGAAKSDDKLDGVLVVWVATGPKGGTFIIGWYRNATIHRHSQTILEEPDREFEGNAVGYYATAKKSDGRLLTKVERGFSVPSKKIGYFGQSNVWYADHPSNVDFRRSVLEYIERDGKQPKKKSPPSKGSPRQPDILLRCKVEEAAMTTTAEYFESKGYSVEAVHREYLGWDLEATLGSIKLQVEVKGLSGVKIDVELTPNEWRQMNDRRDTYYLCVVTNSLKSPVLSVFSHTPENDLWQDDKGRTLIQDKIIAARCHL